MGQQVALVAPVDLGLRTRDDLKAAVKPLDGFWSRSASSAAIRRLVSAGTSLTR